MVDFPPVVFVVALFLLWGATRIGVSVLRRERALDEEVGGHYGLILGAALTLLSLIIGFTFSMAVGRYDQRKNLEEEEANAIGTEYLRADLLPTADATQVKGLLRRYLDQRILFYTVRDASRLKQVEVDTSQLQGALWDAVRRVATSPAAQTSTQVALAVSGMNDVLNSQGYTQAAWWNRIPVAAWVLMASISALGCLLIGFGARHLKEERLLLLTAPLVVALSLFLIADIDSPRNGVIRVAPQNLQSLAESLKTP